MPSTQLAQFLWTSTSTSALFLFQGFITRKTGLTLFFQTSILTDSRYRPFSPPLSFFYQSYTCWISKYPSFALDCISPLNERWSSGALLTLFFHFFSGSYHFEIYAYPGAITQFRKTSRSVGSTELDIHNCDTTHICLHTTTRCRRLNESAITMVGRTSTFRFC